MSFAMESLKVPLCLADAVSDRSCVLANRSLALELQKNSADLACQNALLLQQNDFLMRNFQHLEKACQGLQLNRILAGPPGLTREAPQPLWQPMAGPPGLTKELASNHSGGSTTCSLCDDANSTQSESESGDDKPFTQVVIKNLRHDFTRAKFLDFLRTAGYEDKYDMVYLPTSFETGKCYHYAFVNFLSEQIAQQFHAQLQGCADEDFFGQQHCEVSWSDCQGLPDIIEKYRNSPMMHPSVPDECKPMLFVDGRAVPFPAPTKKDFEAPHKSTFPLVCRFLA
jgi:hypothetical protein